MIKAIKISHANTELISKAMGVGIDGLVTWFPDFTQKYCRDFFVYWEYDNMDHSRVRLCWWVYKAKEFAQLFDVVGGTGSVDIYTQFVEVKER